jgi:DNA-binding CsgD family transcriptional regulator
VAIRSIGDRAGEVLRLASRALGRGGDARPGALIVGEALSRRMMELYSMGLGDREIAEAVGVSRWSVWHWRNRLGLPPRSKRNLLESRFRELYRRGLNDREIGRALGLSHYTVRRWRARLNLPTRHPRREIPREELVSLLSQGLTYGEIAEALGFHPDSIRARRRQLGLPYMFKRGRKPRLHKIVAAKTLAGVTYGETEEFIALKSRISEFEASRARAHERDREICAECGGQRARDQF